MTVKRKASRTEQPHMLTIGDIINKGGKTVGESIVYEVEAEEEIRFTLRIPKKLICKIDKNRESRVGNVSRNQWILEAVADRLS